MDLFQIAWRWVVRHASEEVPSEYALCEFECRKPQCLQWEWANCARRIRQAEGGLMPRSASGRNFSAFEANPSQPSGRESYLPQESVHGEC